MQMSSVSLRNISPPDSRLLSTSVTILSIRDLGPQNKTYWNGQLYIVSTLYNILAYYLVRLSMVSKIQKNDTCHEIGH